MSKIYFVFIFILLIKPLKSISQNEYGNWHSDLSFIYGFRVFDPFLSDTTILKTVGVMPSFGLNLYFPNKRFGVEASRNLWIQLVGGDPMNFDINNYYEVNTLGAFYDCRNHPLRFGINHVWSRIDNFQQSIIEVYHHVYRYKGMSANISYNFWKTRADFRTIIYYNQSHPIHGTSFSFGLTFYFNPLKKKTDLSKSETQN